MPRVGRRSASVSGARHHAQRSERADAGSPTRASSATGVDLPLYARAFVIEENRDGGTRVALVVADIWSCGPLLKERVRELLNERPGAYQYDDATLVIGGTHTHSGIGGYHEYYLYSMTTQGYSGEVRNEMAQGIAAAVMSAEESLAPGRIRRLWHDRRGRRQPLARAHLLNVGAIRNDPSAWVDRGCCCSSSCATFRRAASSPSRC